MIRDPDSFVLKINSFHRRMQFFLRIWHNEGIARTLDKEFFVYAIDTHVFPIVKDNRRKLSELYRQYVNSGGMEIESLYFELWALFKRSWGF